MKYVYIALGVLAILAVSALLICLLVWRRRKRAAKRVRVTPCAVKARELDEALAPFGFMYAEGEDLICSGMYGWQREMGFCRQYDENAPAMNIVCDSEPVYFDYGGKHWLIELWKGQYGCTTGGEIGVYVNTRQECCESPESLFYNCAGDEQRLQMQFSLYKNGSCIMSRKGLHWWLTGFLAGEYSQATELAMEVSIRFPNIPMKDAFCRGLLRAGYCPGEIRTDQTWVSFRFDRPRTRQPEFCKLRLKLVNRRNRRNCALYCRVTGLFCCTLDRICYIGYCFPLLYRKVIRMGAKCNRRRLRRYAGKWMRG